MTQADKETTSNTSSGRTASKNKVVKADAHTLAATKTIQKDLAISLKSDLKLFRKFGLLEKN